MSDDPPDIKLAATLSTFIQPLNLAVQLVVLVLFINHLYFRRDSDVERKEDTSKNDGSSHDRNSRDRNSRDRSGSRSKPEPTIAQQMDPLIKWLSVGVFVSATCQAFSENLYLMGVSCFSVLPWFWFSFYFINRCLLLLVFCARFYLVAVSKQWQTVVKSFAVASIIIWTISILWLGVTLKRGVHYSFFGNQVCMNSSPFISVLWVLFSDVIINFSILGFMVHRLRQIRLISAEVYGAEMTRTSVNTGQIQAHRELLAMTRKIALVTVFAWITTLVCCYLGFLIYPPLRALKGVDTAMNSFAVFVLFQFNHWMIEPCVGKHCDRCCKCCCGGQRCCSDDTDFKASNLTEIVNTTELTIPNNQSSSGASSESIKK